MNDTTVKIILASTSPRRKEILEKMGVAFQVVASKYEEDMSLPLSPSDLVKHLAMGKAVDVANRFPECLVIGADTIVVLGDEVMGKPHTNDVAEEMLKKLSGKKHQVITGLAIIYKEGGVMINEVMPTSVYVKNLNKKEISEYIATGEPLDKAGAYAVQGLGGALIEKTEGDYWNLVGLPAGRVATHLRAFGINAVEL
ncbi:MAG: Maf family protein [Candidatus Taylorbacteria bacterium]|nr:Maf family protein [Candidatus Taylorbacteria bacterium]